MVNHEFSKLYQLWLKKKNHKLVLQPIQENFFVLGEDTVEGWGFGRWPPAKMCEMLMRQLKIVTWGERFQRSELKFQGLRTIRLRV